MLNNKVRYFKSNFRICFKFSRFLYKFLFKKYVTFSYIFLIIKTKNFCLQKKYTIFFFLFRKILKFWNCCIYLNFYFNRCGRFQWMANVNCESRQNHLQIHNKQFFIIFFSFSIQNFKTHTQLQTLFYKKKQINTLV